MAERKDLSVATKASCNKKSLQCVLGGIISMLILGGLFYSDTTSQVDKKRKEKLKQQVEAKRRRIELEERLKQKAKQDAEWEEEKRKREAKRKIRMEKEGRENPPLGFKYLRIKTYSCGGQTHTVAEYLHEKTGWSLSKFQREALQWLKMMRPLSDW